MKLKKTNEMEDGYILLMAISQRSKMNQDIYVAEWFLDADGTTDLQLLQYPSMAEFLAEVADWNMQGVKTAAIVCGDEMAKKELADLLSVFEVPVINPELSGFFNIARTPQAFARITGILYEVDQRDRDLAATVIIHNYKSAQKLYEQAKKIGH